MIEKFISYLPHGKEIIALREILELGENNINCRVLANGSPFNAIEYFAQAAALGRIANAKSNTVKLGMIIRIKEFQIFSKQLCQTVQCSWSESLGGAYEVQAQGFDQNNNLVSAAIITMMEQE